MENNKIKDKIDELVESLNRASKAYYNGADGINAKLRVGCTV